MNDELLWVERYRPKRIKDVILPKHLKSVFKGFVEAKHVPNLLLCGGPGSGKTTVAKAMLDELNTDFMVINASLDRNIDTLRNEVLAYASTMSFSGTRKYVILDEADYLNPTSFQPALRNFIENFSKNCGFIFTCNYPNKIIPALHSRTTVIDFKIPVAERSKMASAFYQRCEAILIENDIKYDAEVLRQVIMKWFPDWRRTLNELQRYSATGQIDSGLLIAFEEISMDKVIGFIKDRDFTKARKWVGENSNCDVSDFYTKLYQDLPGMLIPEAIPHLVICLAEYQAASAWSTNKEINMSGCLADLMLKLSDGWK